MKKILVDARWIRIKSRGIGVFTSSLLDELLKQVNFDVIIFVVLHQECVNDFSYVVSDRVKIIILPKWPDPLLDLLYFGYLIARFKIDLVHFTGNSGLCLFNRNCRVLITVHDVAYMKSAKIVPYSRNLYQFIGRIYRKIFVPLSVRYSDSLITVSNFASCDIRDELKLKNPPEYIYHGVKSFDNIESVAQDCVFSKNYVVVGGMDPQKNLACVVRAFQIIEEHNLFNIPCLSVIGVDKKAFIRYYPHEKIPGNVFFHGYRDHEYVKFAIVNSKCVIVPSLYESFGLPLLEAIKLNKPVISSNKGALPEIGGCAPLYFNPKSVEELIEAIADFEKSPDRTQQLLCWNSNFSDKFNWASCAQFYLKIYQKLLA